VRVPRVMRGACLGSVLALGLAVALTGCGDDAAEAGGAQAPRVLWGAWTDTHRTRDTQPPYDMTAAVQLERQVGKRMSLLGFSTPMGTRWGEAYYEFPTALFDTVRRHGSVPFFSWSTTRLRRPAAADFTLRAVLAGRHDAYLRRWARAAKAWGRPFFLRLNWEMNGDWFPWAERYGSNRSGEYVATWRHVHDIFSDVGVTNVRWVWCPAADVSGGLQSLRELYPGDRYVDWTGLDGYNRDEPWTPFAGVMRSTYRRILDIAPAKPMVIAETASTEGGGDKAAWIAAMFRDLPRRFPKVRALVWYDRRDGGSSPRTDWPLDSSKAATEAFADGVSADRYRAGG
jgi:mannan endo-1,4-beta-mannosidase